MSAPNPYESPRSEAHTEAHTASPIRTNRLGFVGLVLGIVAWVSTFALFLLFFFLPEEARSWIVETPLVVFGAVPHVSCIVGFACSCAGLLRKPRRPAIWGIAVSSAMLLLAICGIALTTL